MAYGLHSRRREVEEIPLKVLFVRIGAMGDVLHGLPAAAALRQRLPNCVIGWAVEPKWAPLLVDETGKGPVVTRIHPVATRAWRRSPLSPKTLLGILKLRSEIAKQKYDICIDLQGAIKSAVLGRIAGAEHFLGPDKPRERPARLLYGKRVDVRSPHVIEQACELVKAALATQVEDWMEVAGLAPVKVTLPTDAEAERWCDQTLRDLGIGPEGFVLFAPSAGWGAKQWQPQRYAELAKRLAEAGHRVLVNGGTAADEATIAEITTAGDAIRVDSDVAQLIALTRRARLVVGGDTGPVHLAAALERPVVALYGPTDPARNGPFFIGSRVRVVRSPTSRVDYARYQRIEAGLATVTEDEVLASILTLLNGPTGERPRSPSTADGFGTDIFVESTFKTAAFRTDSLFKSLQKEEPETKQADANG